MMSVGTQESDRFSFLGGRLHFYFVFIGFRDNEFAATLWALAWFPNAVGTRL